MPTLTQAQAFFNMQAVKLPAAFISLLAQRNEPKKWHPTALLFEFLHPHKFEGPRLRRSTPSEFI